MRRGQRNLFPQGAQKDVHNLLKQNNIKSRNKRLGAMSGLAVIAVLFASSTYWGEVWQTKESDVAHAVGIVASDGAPASLEVRCRPKPDVTLTHPALASMPTDGKGQLDWDQGALVYDGWGLDLTRPDHSGHLGIWVRCAHRPDCVRPRPDDIEWIVKQLRQQWSWFIRIQRPDARVVDLRVSLVGAARAIDAVCPPPETVERD